ncbi:MAG: hypothetical protein Q9171_003205 [Xanthocarpia ochracea]
MKVSSILITIAQIAMTVSAHVAPPSADDERGTINATELATSSSKLMARDCWSCGSSGEWCWLAARGGAGAWLTCGNSDQCAPDSVGDAGCGKVNRLAVEDRLANGQDDLKAAHIVNEYLAWRPSPHTKETQDKVSDVEETEVSNPGPKKLAIGVEENRDTTTPTLTWRKLLDVPPEHTAWLVANGVPEKKPALAAALREEGVPAVGISYEIDVAWQVPSIFLAPKDCFYDSLTAAPLTKTRLNTLG